MKLKIFSNTANSFQSKVVIFFISSLVLLFPSAMFAEIKGEVNGRVKVGVILPMSGEFARYGDKIREGLERDRPKNVQYIYDDEGCNPQVAVRAHKKLTVVDGVRVILGPWCGSPQVVVASLLEQHDQVAILGSSAPRRVFELSNGRMLSLQHSIEEESIYNAEQSYSLGSRKVVIVFFENDFSRAHEAAYRSTFKGSILETLTYTSTDASSLRALALKIKQLNPDTLYIPDAFPLMHGLLGHLKGIGVSELKIFSVYSAQSEDVIKTVGPAGEGMLISYPKIKMEDGGDATSDIEALHHYPRLVSVMLGQSLIKCPTAEPQCIRNSLKEITTFDEFGVMRGEIGFKELKGGKFEWVAAQ